MSFFHSKSKKTHIIFLLIIVSLAVGVPFFRISHQPNHEQYHTNLLKRLEKAKTFSEFADTLFCYEVTNDSITTSYTLKNIKKYQIPSLPPKLSSFTFDQYDSQSKNQTEQQRIQFIQNKLTQFSSSRLSQKNQLTYDLLAKRLSLQKKITSYSYYEDLLGPNSGIPSNLPVTLCEYPLRTKKDVETYLSLLKQIPSYFSNIIKYEIKREQLGYITPVFIRQDTLKNLHTFLDGLDQQNNCFSETFCERIKNISSLSKQQRIQYQKEHDSIIKRQVIPAFSNIQKFIKQSISTTKSSVNVQESSSRNKDSLPNPDIPYGLSSLPNGKDYYTLLVEWNTGSSKSPSELIALTESKLQNTLQQVKYITEQEPETYLYYYEHPTVSYYQSPQSILEALSLMIRKDFPTLPEQPRYTVKTVPKSMEAQLSPAFYMLPAIDEPDHNTIYINEKYTNNENGNLFTTLAHEGFPGHLYQTVYFNRSKPDSIRHILDYPGYVEGWATYVELHSFSYLKYPKDKPSLCSYYMADTIISLALSSRIDLGVNYENWCLNDVNQFFHKYGFQSYYAADLYAYVIENPATYLRYFIGFLEIEQLKQDFMAQKGNIASEKVFHKQLLDIGPGDFNTIRNYLLPNGEKNKEQRVQSTLAAKRRLFGS